MAITLNNATVNRSLADLSLRAVLIQWGCWQTSPWWLWWPSDMLQNLLFWQAPPGSCFFHNLFNWPTHTMTDSYASIVSLIGRILLALMFIPAGFGKLANVAGTTGYFASKGLPFGSVLVVLVGALELFGGLALVLGFKVRWVGLALALFTLGASLVGHAYWSMPEGQQMVNQMLFMKNISVMGGMLLVSALGAGAISWDARSR